MDSDGPLILSCHQALGGLSLQRRGVPERRGTLPPEHSIHQALDTCLTGVFAQGKPGGVGGAGRAGEGSGAFPPGQCAAGTCTGGVSEGRPAKRLLCNSGGTPELGSSL